MTLDEAVKVLQLCFAVYQSADERGPVDPADHHGVRRAVRLARGPGAPPS